MSNNPLWIRKKTILYYDIVLAGLPQAPRVRREAYMTTTLGHEFRSDWARGIAAQDEARGEALGEGRAC
jgi:hypothetical protein